MNKELEAYVNKSRAEIMQQYNINLTDSVKNIAIAELDSRTDLEAIDEFVYTCIVENMQPALAVRNKLTTKFKLSPLAAAYLVSEYNTAIAKGINLELEYSRLSLQIDLKIAKLNELAQTAMDAGIDASADPQLLYQDILKWVDLKIKLLGQGLQAASATRIKESIQEQAGSTDDLVKRLDELKKLKEESNT